MNNVATALVFCAMGDLFLHMEDHPSVGHETWFLSGLVSFLIGHIFFMLSLSKRSYNLLKSSGIPQKDNFEKLFVILYLVTLLMILVPNIEA